MMDVLSKHGIRATATTNTDICEYHPQIIEDAVKLGWEFMGHNKTNTTRLTALAAGEERELIRYCTRRLQQATGKRPVGWLGSGLAETWDTVDYLSENEYLYVSDWVNDDQPYRMKVASGKELVYLPYSYEVNDSNQINYRFQTAEDFGTIIRNTFDVLYEEGADSARVMAICLHPFMTGVPHRIRALDNALKYIKGHDDVWFATGEEIVRAYLASDASI
jgi:peptidoglycan/xylan/chitin deacetylase (PgdA/CDA1 family)